MNKIDVLNERERIAFEKGYDIGRSHIKLNNVLHCCEMVEDPNDDEEIESFDPDMNIIVEYKNDIEATNNLGNDTFRIMNAVKEIIRNCNRCNANSRYYAFEIERKIPEMIDFNTYNSIKCIMVQIPMSECGYGQLIIANFDEKSKEDDVIELRTDKEFIGCYPRNSIFDEYNEYKEFPHKKDFDDLVKSMRDSKFFDTLMRGTIDYALKSSPFAGDDDDDDEDDEVIELSTEEFDKIYNYIVEKACLGDKEARKILVEFLDDDAVLPFKPYE